MGTRSLTYVYQEYPPQAEDGTGGIPAPIITMYRQFDGYPTCHGRELAEFLSGRTLVKYSSDESKQVSNGMSDLAAQLVCYFKKQHETGGIYLHTPIMGQFAWQEYEYHIWEDKVAIYKGVYQHSAPIFEGSWAELEEYCSVERYGEEHDEIVFTPEAIDVVKEGLINGRVIINFRKNDGTMRKLVGTLNEDFLPDFTPTESTKPKNDEVLAVWDIENKGWRSFRWDSVKTVEIL
jgi:hypothetical protein